MSSTNTGSRIFFNLMYVAAIYSAAISPDSTAYQDTQRVINYGITYDWLSIADSPLVDSHYMDSAGFLFLPRC